MSFDMRGRGRAILLAWVLAAQTVGPALALVNTVRMSCCCIGKDKKCHCPACTRNRIIESGHGVVGSCGMSSDHALTSPLQAAIVPVALAEPRIASVMLSSQPATAPPPPIMEVPTPPPWRDAVFED